MTLYSDKLKHSHSDLDINKDGVLIKCLIKDGTVTIPEDVIAVVADAFQGCENVKINKSEEYIVGALAKSVFYSMKSIKHEFKIHPIFTGYGNYYPNIKVSGMDADSIEKAVRKAIETDKNGDPASEWKLTIIDAETIPQINKEIELLGRDNLVQENENSVSTLHDIPFLIKTPVQQIPQYVNEIITKEGFGILFIKNLTSEVQKVLHPNFVYNLIKSHSFDFVRLSPKWLLIVEIGKGVKLGPSISDCGEWFTTRYYKDISTEQFLKDVKREKKLIEVDNVCNTQETTSNIMETNNKNDEPRETPSSPTTMKETDWEERHFQICLSLLSRSDLCSYHNNTVSTKEINIHKIIRKADEIMEELKKHYEEKFK